MKNLYKFFTVISFITFYGLDVNAQCDTLRNWDPNGPLQIFEGSTGYIPGHETQPAPWGNVLRWAEPYNLPTADSVKGLVIGIHTLENVGGSSVTFNIWSEAGGLPNTVLTSEVVDFNDLQAGFFNVVNFSNPVEITGDFFVGFELDYSNPDDTLGVIAQTSAANSLFFFTNEDGWEPATIYGDNFNTVMDVLTSPSDVPEPDFVSNTTLQICDGSNFEVDADGHAQNMTEFNWELWTWDPVAEELIDLIDESSGSPQASLTPDGTGDYAIALFSQESCSFEAVLYSGFEVIPEFEYDLNVTDESCQGEDGAIELTNFSGGSGDYVYSWANNFYYLYNNPPHDTTDLEAGTYNLNFGAVDLDGTNFSFLSGCEINETVTVDFIPGEEITVDPNTTICEGDNVTLNASGNGSIEWFASGVSQGTGTSINVSPTSNVNYEAVLTDANGCTDSDFIVVTVNSENANFTFNDFCEGSPNNTPTNINTTGGTFSLVAGTSGSGSIDASTGEITGATEGEVYEVNYEITGTCPDDVTQTVNITGSDDASFDYDTPCANSTILPSNIVTPSGSWTLSGTPPTGVNIDANTGEITGATAGDMIDVTYTTPAGACQDDETITVEIFAQPNVTASADFTTVCEGDEVNLDASGADSYNWDSGIGAGASHTITVNSTSTYTVTGTDNNNCSATDAVTVTANPLPTIDAGSDVTVCEGEEVTLEASVQGGVNVTWNGGIDDGVPFTPGLGVTAYEATANDGTCTNTDELTVTVNAGPTVTLGDDEELCINDEVFILSGSPSGGTFTGPGVDGNEFDPEDAGVGQHTITYTVEDLSNCEGEGTMVITVIDNDEDCFLSVKDNEPFSELSIMPNPASEYVNIVVGSNTTVDRIEMISVTGQVVSTNITANGNIHKINLTNINKGAYFVRIYAGNNQITRKVIVD